MNQHCKEVIQQLDREKAERARRMRPEFKLAAGPYLFDLACRIVKDNIRAEMPNADETAVQAELKRRLWIARLVEDRAI